MQLIQNIQDYIFQVNFCLLFDSIVERGRKWGLTRSRGPPDVGCDPGLAAAGTPAQPTEPLSAPIQDYIYTNLNMSVLH